MGEILLDLQEKEIIEGQEPVNIKIINTTDEQLIYKILVGKDGIWETLKDFNDSHELEWVPEREGNYMIIAQAKKENSKKPFDYKVSQSIVVELNEEKIIKKLNIDRDNIKIGEKITLEVESLKESAMYRYFIGEENDRDDREEWQIIRDYSTDNKLTYTVNRSGKFSFLVESKRQESLENFEDYKTIGFTVSNFEKPEIIDFKCLTEELLVDEDLIFEVKTNIEEERTVLYKFIKISPDGSTSCIQDYSSKRVVTLKEKIHGGYKLLCLVRDMYSSNEYDDRAIIVYEVKPYRDIQLKNFITDLSSPQVRGSNIIIKAMTEGGSNLLYRFKIDGNVKEDSGYIKSNIYNWDTKVEGDYTITLWVKDESFKGDYEVSSSITYTLEEYRVKPVKITDVVFNKDKDYLINEPINIKVLTDSNSNVKYSFIISKDSENKEFIEYCDNNWVEFIPKEKGEYQLEIRVKDIYSEKEYDAHTLLYFKVKEYIEGKIEHILVPAKGYFVVGDNIEIESICQNTKETYIKYVTKINEQIVEETEYISSKKMSILPKCPGKYVIEMYVKNIKCKIGFDTKREVRFYVSDALPINNTKISSDKTEYNINEEITFTTNSQGGVKVCYEYYMMINGSWILMQKYSRKNYYTFTPFTSGNYRMLVLSKSHYKKCAYEDYDTFEFHVKDTV